MNHSFSPQNFSESSFQCFVKTFSTRLKAPERAPQVRHLRSSPLSLKRNLMTDGVSVNGKKKNIFRNNENHSDVRSKASNNLWLLSALAALPTPL
jgi:hypothetical protein